MPASIMAHHLLHASVPTKILLPDLITYCNLPARKNRHGKRADRECNLWFLRHAPVTDDETRRAIRGVKAGLLSSYCLPRAGYPQLRVCSDFMSWVFHFDDVTDEMSERGLTCVASDVMNMFWHTETYAPTTWAAGIARE